MAFFSVKQPEKEAALLYILREIIKVPLSSPSSEAKIDDDKPTTEGKRKKKKSQISQYAAFPHQTLIFVSTKHHVEYISALLSLAGYECSYVYGTLDQTARKIQINNFRNGKTNLLVVTDVAARGIDIPILENVINYDFVDSSKMFVHRVGRTARAGRRGWAYSLITSDEVFVKQCINYTSMSRIFHGGCINTPSASLSTRSPTFPWSTSSRWFDIEFTSGLFIRHNTRLLPPRHS